MSRMDMDLWTFRFLTFALLGIGFAGGWLTWGIDKREYIVDAKQTLGAEGAQFAFTLPRTQEVHYELSLPKGTTIKPAVAQLLPAMRPDLVFVPERVYRHPATADSHGVYFSRRDHAGAYVLRIPPVPTAMGEAGVAVRVRIWLD